MNKLLITLLLLITAFPAWACSCGGVGIYKSYKGANYIFTGTLLSTKAIPMTDTLTGHKDRFHGFRFTFKVQHVYKGTRTADTVSITVPVRYADCPNGFAPDKSYLIYSYMTDEPPSIFFDNGTKVIPYLTTHRCTRTKPNRFLTLYEKVVLTIL